MNRDFTDKKSNICLKKKKFVQSVSPEKKFLHKQWAKKKIVQAENSPPPPPPHHFSNGPSLRKGYNDPSKYKCWKLFRATLITPPVFTAKKNSVRR